VNKNSQNSSKPPSSDPPQKEKYPKPEPTGEKPGGRNGHHGWTEAERGRRVVYFGHVELFARMPHTPFFLGLWVVAHAVSLPFCHPLFP
jgi:hypothetical protein